MIDLTHLNATLLTTFGVPVRLLERELVGLYDPNTKVDNLGYIAVDNEHPSIMLNTSDVVGLDITRNETILINDREYSVVAVGKDDEGFTKITVMRVLD